MHAGTAPLAVSSGKSLRHRLNRAGNRQLNATIHMIALTQARMHPPAIAFMARKQGEGMSDREALPLPEAAHRTHRVPHHAAGGASPAGAARGRRSRPQSSPSPCSIDIGATVDALRAQLMCNTLVPLPQAHCHPCTVTV